MLHCASLYAKTLNPPKRCDLKENQASCERENFLFLTPFPPPPSHSNHQLERLFIDPLLPSASSYPPYTPVSFLSRSLPPFVSRAVGQRERDVAGIENVRKDERGVLEAQN